MSRARRSARRSDPGPPRLLLAVTHPMTADLLMRGQLAALVARGFRVAVLSSPGPQLDAVARREGVEVLPVALRRRPAPLADLVAVARAYRALRRFRPHLVNAGTPKAGLVVGLAAFLARVPRRLYTLRGLPLETASGVRRFPLVVAESLASATTHRVVCVGESLRQRYVGLKLTREEKTRVVGDGASNGVDVERFRPAARGAFGSDPEIAALGRELDLPEGAPVIGFVGRFTRDKGIADLATAFYDHLLPRFPEARLLLLGEFEAGDPVEPATRRRLEEDPRVVRPGFVADTASWYRAMDVLAFPSHREGFPNAPLEAAASGVPVAGFAATGTVDAVEDGVTGTLVPVGDAAALAVALAAYLEDPELARRHGAAGRRRAVERFANHRVWQAWADLYAEELATAGLPEPSAGGTPAGAGTPSRPPGRRHRLYRAFGKRLADLALTLPALVLLSPLIWTLALLVRLFLGSPVLFRQTRPGRGGEPFTLLKFRTMTDETDVDGDLLPDAERLTRFGRFLRRTSLDELPELVNVLRGDMSLVGPRPLLMHYLERYTPRQALRHEVRPGITGWAVVHGRNALTWEEKFELDVDYVERLSPALDAKILTTTVRMVVTGSGVSAAGHSTMPEYTGPPGDEEEGG